MCGIAGIVSKSSHHVSRERIQKTSSCLRHRGPEEEAIWLNSNNEIALAHLRLSIIDRSPEAAQPMHYLQRYTIVHNGELYNYIEIKDQLRREGYSFFSSSDTEVIVAAFNKWGSDCLKHFDGMFAFAIWDEKEKNLFAARDRFGEKPFFFFYDEEQLIFTSEMKSIWGAGISKNVNRAMLYNFLTIGYTSNPADPQETFYQNIYKLPAASFLNYSPGNGQLKVEKYWQVQPETKPVSEADAVEQFKSLFAESIRRRLRSDVSIGTSLSGGLDSSSIVAFCEKEVSDHYTHKCFTASFEGFEKDELKYAEMVAKHFGLEHYVVTTNEDEIPQLMQEVMHHQEEPFRSASVLAQYKVFQAAKLNGVTVLLDGQGADETLAGYTKYYKWYWQQLYREKKLSGSKELRKAREIGVVEPFELNYRLAALFPEFAAAILQTRKARKAFRHPDLNRDFAFSNKQNSYYTTPAIFDLNGALYYNSFVNGLEELLRYADRNSMAHALEVRLPFLNHQLVEFLFSLPAHFKIQNGWTKWLLRKTVDSLLPKEITWRKNKIGFEPPQKKWMENKSVQQCMEAGKRKLADHEILNSPSAAKKIKPHNAYAANDQDWKYWSASFLFD